jgi:hypothetical protein
VKVAARLVLVWLPKSSLNSFVAQQHKGMAFAL